METCGEYSATRLIGAFAIVLIGVAIASCGGGGGGGGGGAGGGAGPLAGVFTDDPVEGLTYVSRTQSGVTDSDGGFRYPRSGGRITFMIGDIEIGNGDAAALMTPVDLVKDEDPNAVDETHEWVTNIARFLQTVDDDGDPNNGIRITQAVRDAAAGLAVEFEQPLADFEGDAAMQAAVAGLTAVTEAGLRTLVSADDAREQLRHTRLLNSLAGRYVGTLEAPSDPPTSANWTIHVDAAGNVSGSVTFNTGPLIGRNSQRIFDRLPITLVQTGMLSSNGDFFASGSRGTRLRGHVSDGIVDGTWYMCTSYCDSILLYGTFEGQATPPGD